MSDIYTGKTYSPNDVGVAAVTETPGVKTPEMKAQIDEAIAAATDVETEPPPMIKIFEYVVVEHPISAKGEGRIVEGPKLILAIDEGNARATLKVQYPNADFFDANAGSFEHLYDEAMIAAKKELRRIKKSVFGGPVDANAVAGLKATTEIRIREF